MRERVFTDCSNRMQRWRKGATPVLKALTLLALALLVAACRGKASDPAATQGQPAPSGPAAAVKLMVEADGIYTVPAAALRSAGFDLTTVSPETFALTRGGSRSCFRWSGKEKTGRCASTARCRRLDRVRRPERLLAGADLGRPGGDCRAAGSPSRRRGTGYHPDDSRLGHNAC